MARRKLSFLLTLFVVGFCLFFLWNKDVHSKPPQQPNEELPLVKEDLPPVNENLPPVKVDVYYSKNDPHWKETEAAIDAVAKEFKRLQITKISIDDDKGYSQLV